MCGWRQRKWNRRPSNFARRWSLMERSSMSHAGAKSGFRTTFRALGVHILWAIGSIPMTTAGTVHRIDPKRRGDGLYSTMYAGRLATVSAYLGSPAATRVIPGAIGPPAAA